MSPNDRTRLTRLDSSERPTTCFTCQSRDKAEWCVLADEDLQLLNRSKISNTYEPGQVIFYQDNPCLGIHCIEEGTVALRKSGEGGNSIIVRLFHEGDTLGYLAYFSGSGYTATAEALTRCRVCFVDRAAVRKLVEDNPAVGLQFLKRTAENLRQAEDSRLQEATHPLRVRLAHILLVLRDRFGSVDDEGVLTIELPMSRQDLASMLGTRPETMSRTIRQLEATGAARFDKRLVRVPDLDLLLDQLELEI